MKYEAEIKKALGNMKIKGEKAWRRSIAAVKSSVGRMVKLARRGVAQVVVHKETLGYYAVLTLVLVALGAAANDYRSRKATQQLVDSLPTADPGVVVQSKPDPTLAPEAEKPAYIMPVEGTLVGEFCDDELTWSTTLQLWQTHPAVDIAAPAGVTVVSAADGTVTEAYTDALYGNVIAIEHEDGSVLRYSSLNTLKLVEVGAKVSQGDVISAVGVCNAEADLGAHVHLEYLVDDQPQDFSLLIEDGLQN